MSVNLTAAFIEAAKSPERGQVDHWDRKLSGFGLRVSEGGTKSFFAYYRHNGIKRRFTIGRFPSLSLADARNKAQRILGQVAHGIDPAAQKLAGRDADTFAELAQTYLTRHAAKKRSFREDERIINRELLPRWRNRKAADLTRKDVIVLLDGIVDRGSPIMANRTKALISKIFNFGIGRGVVEHNPAHKVPSPGQEQQRDRVLSDAEIRAVWQALELEQPKLAGIFRLALLTAQRRGEVLGMTWDELDLANGWWTIRAERSKNGLTHRVPLGPRAIAILDELKKAARDGSTNVFPGSKAGEPIANLQKPLRRIKERSKVEFKFHDLRRTAASHMTGLGIPRLVVSKILNHVERDITAVYDRHGYDKEKRKALLKWDRRVREIIQELKPSKVVELHAG